MKVTIEVEACDTCGIEITDLKCGSCGKLLCDNCAIRARLPKHAIEYKFTLETKSLNPSPLPRDVDAYKIKTTEIKNDRICHTCAGKYYPEYFRIVRELERSERTVEELEKRLTDEYAKVKHDKYWRDY
jgi:hypothetical protein